MHDFLYFTACPPASQLYAAALRLDGPTLANLELLENNTGESAGSLLSRLDTCACAGGGLITVYGDACIIEDIKCTAWGRLPACTIG
jgi:hypothetical protein